MNDFKIGQLTKVLVTERLRKLDDRCAAAAELVKQILLVALKQAPPANPAWRQVAQDACQGAMTAILLCELDVAQGALKLLTSTAEAAYELNLDPEQMRESALKGIVDIRRFISADKVLKIQAELSRHFPKAAKVFSSLFYTDLVKDLHAVGPS